MPSPLAQFSDEFKAWLDENIPPGIGYVVLTIDVETQLCDSRSNLNMESVRTVIVDAAVKLQIGDFRRARNGETTEEAHRAHMARRRSTDRRN